MQLWVHHSYISYWAMMPFRDKPRSSFESIRFAGNRVGLAMTLCLCFIIELPWAALKILGTWNPTQDGASQAYFTTNAKQCHAERLALLVTYCNKLSVFTPCLGFRLCIVDSPGHDKTWQATPHLQRYQLQVFHACKGAAAMQNSATLFKTSWERIYYVSYTAVGELSLRRQSACWPFRWWDSGLHLSNCHTYWESLYFSLQNCIQRGYALQSSNFLVSSTMWRCSQNKTVNVKTAWKSALYLCICLGQDGDHVDYGFHMHAKWHIASQMQ